MFATFLIFQIFFTVFGQRITDPYRPMFALQIINCMHRDAHSPQHVGPVAIATSDFYHCSLTRYSFDNFQTLIARYHTTEMMHEDWEDVMASLYVRSPIFGPGPF